MGTDLRWFVHTWTTTAPPNPAYTELISHLTTQCLIDGDRLKMICKYMDSTTAPPNSAYTELISHLTTVCLIDGDRLKMICTYMDYHCTTQSSLH